MARNAVTIPVWNDSDGQHAPAKDRSRNDGYFEERLGDLWMKERGQAQPGVLYRLDRMPTGYSGWEKRREGTKHIDRYIAGHPSGKDFRSLNEAWPHFRHLIAHGSADGCLCILCSGGRKNTKSTRTSASAPAASKSSRKVAARKTQNTTDSDSETPQRSKQADAEGIPDYYRILLDKLKAAGPNGTVRENVVDQLSPDWRAGHQMLQGMLDDWSHQPAFVPRLGELVIFIRSLGEGDTGYRWEAGVVTQLPIEPVSQHDLLGIPPSKKQGITYSGFRVEPLPEPGNQYKPYSLQHKYVPLHALRPFVYWRECLERRNEQEWHPTIKHALTVSSSWSLLGKYHFAGSWPEATLFCRGVYLGSELIMMGDTVRLEPRPRESRQDEEMEVIVVSSIRLRFVKLDEASDDDYDNGNSYTTCLHIAGKAYTLDPKRSFGGIGASPARPDQPGFPPELVAYGNWFNLTDPLNDRQKLEVPYTRVLGRCLAREDLECWFTPCETHSQIATIKPLSLSQGLDSIQEARAYSTAHDTRIDRASGQSWFWAETRIEQLDLHEVNGKFVGSKDEDRNRKQVNAWRQALKVLDGNLKKGSLDDYLAAKRMREEEFKQQVAASSAFSMVTSAAQRDSATDGEAVEGGDLMDVDDDAASSRRASSMQMLSMDDDEADDDSVMIIDD
ncbi:hypothetical protein CERZMDRAFT_35160 [Cercospora zeae-maydis SCOH1-5]|uniref:Cryptic loci regulator 2 N-terminal domain-containing protein n=1 Tax=Cercospora zeae-maydis SCOH1-5 TaxID=717836 RepID=A0A6A6FQY4_9PEZI|nr:hypothetical protein CERZMDRAFT_35160 [Cercospora zeae-maydis SCOH1-5]